MGITMLQKNGGRKTMYPSKVNRANTKIRHLFVLEVLYDC